MPAHLTRVFLDANVLFSAAYRIDAPLIRLWTTEHVIVITSAYAAAEASRNLPDETQRTRLNLLLARTAMRDVHNVPDLPEHIVLPEKDRPILQAAIAARAVFLLTGDRTHFGPYYERTIEGVTILPPATFFARIGR